VTVVGRVTRKEAGGKLYSVDVICEGENVSSVRISGEFFAYPEDLIDSMEAALRGVRLEAVPVAQAIAGALFYSHGTLVGIRASELVSAIVEAGKKS
jgi:hypothetical protein